MAIIPVGTAKHKRYTILNMLFELGGFSVSKKWHQANWLFMVLSNVTFIMLYLMPRFFPETMNALSIFSNNTGMFALAALNLAYLVLPYWILARRNTALATFVGTLLFAFGVLSGLLYSEPSAIIILFVAIWWMTSFLTGSYGLQPLLGWCFLTIVYVLLRSQFRFENVSLADAILVGGDILVTIVGYFFWSTRYENVDSEKLTELSSMLQSNQQQSEVLLQSLADGIIVTDTQGRITIMNSAAASMTEWDINEARNVDAQVVVQLTKENGDAIPPAENPFGVAMNRRQHINQILRLTGRSQKKFIISLVISPLLDANNTLIGAIAVMRDISEERKTQQQRAEFISTASHEMRTPVAAIEGYLELAMNEKVGTIDAKARAFLEKAQASTQHLGRLFQDLLTSSKAEDGRLGSYPVPVEMASFLQQTTDSVRFTAEKKNLAVEFILGKSGEANSTNVTHDAATEHMLKPLFYALIDPDRMREVITNLFDNACKYTDSGKITIGLTANADTIQIYVHDTGAGIPADDIPHLFQKFYRVDNSATRTIGGTGLGLFICRKIVELYHGHIWVESTVGKGSTFYINLPRLSAQRASALQPAKADDTAEKLPPQTPPV